MKAAPSILIHTARIYIYFLALGGFLASDLINKKTLYLNISNSLDFTFFLICSFFIIYSTLKSPNKNKIVTIAMIFLFFFIPYTLIISIINNSEIGNSLRNIYAQTRLIITLSAFLLLSEMLHSGMIFSISKKIKKDIYFLATIQISASFIQIFYPDIAIKIIPNVNPFDSSLRAFINDNEISGVFRNTIDFSFFLLASYIVLHALNLIENKKNHIAISLVFGFFIIKSGSMAAVVCFFTFFISTLIIRLKIKTKLIIAIIISLVFLYFVIANIESISQELNAKIENMMLSRLGLIFISFPEMLSTIPLKIFFGISQDLSIVLQNIQNYSNAPTVFYIDEGATNLINDVYWLALLFTCGIPLGFLYIFILFKLWKQYSYAEYKNSIFHTVVLMVLFIGFFNQVIFIRSFIYVLILGILPYSIFIKNQNQHQFFANSKQLKNIRDENLTNK